MQLDVHCSSLKCLFLLTAEADDALGQTFPLPKHQ